jgi:O6-methylguanine-DNA--protein-cysteine methyltransferase
MSSWIEDEVDDADNSPDGEPETSDAADGEEFAKQLQAIVAAGNSTIATELLEDGLPQVEDVDLLQRTLDHVDTGEKRRMVEERLEELGADTTDTDDEPEQESSDAAETDESDEADDETDEPEIAHAEFEEFDTDIRQAILDGVLDTIPMGSIREYAGQLDDDVIERAVEEAERDEALEIFESEHAERQQDPVSEPEESVFEDESGSDDADDDESEVFGDTSDDTDEVEEDDTDDESTVTPDEIPDGEPDWKDSFDSAASQSGGVSVNEAADMEKRWSMLVWSDPGKGKTHFGYTTKEPVCIIDTEGKAHHLSDKFTDKTVRLFQPSDYDEALDALHDALDLLHDVYEKHGRVGTIVVDSMSIMWEWSQQKYVDKFYRGKDVDEVEFSSAIGSGGQSDWKQIKRYHNVKFRQAILDSPFHFVWTAMSADDYEAAIENDINFTPKKPSGEKNNEYKASEVLRLRENDAGDTVGELEKSDKIKHHYTDLNDPDFPKHKEVVEAIKNAEAGDRSIQSVESEFDVTVFEGNPRTARIAEEK